MKADTAHPDESQVSIRFEPRLAPRAGRIWALGGEGLPAVRAMSGFRRAPLCKLLFGGTYRGFAFSPEAATGQQRRCAVRLFDYPVRAHE